MKSNLKSIIVFLSVFFTTSVFAQSDWKKYDLKVTQPGMVYDETPGEVFAGEYDELKITGPLNTYDLRIVREFCGGTDIGANCDGSIKVLDLSDATISTDCPSHMYYLRVYDYDLKEEIQYKVEEGEDDLLPTKLFYRCCKVEKIILPKYIKRIGVGAFWQCASLKDIVIPDDVTEIKSTAFGGCGELEEINLPSKLNKLGGYAFCYCPKLKEVTIPEGVKKLGMHMFIRDESLTRVNLPSTMESFDEECFREAIALKEINIPEGITTLEENTFNFCESLEKVTFPSSLKEIKNSAFIGCGNLSELNFKEGLQIIGERAFVELPNIKKLNFPNSLETIGMEAFCKCYGVEEINFGKNLKEIDEKAFFQNNVKKIVLPENLEVISYASFFECSNLEEVDFGISAPEVLENPFGGCFNMKRFTVSDDNPKFKVVNNALCNKEGTFLYSYPNLAGTKLVMGEDIEEIDNFSLWYCTNLEELEFSPKFMSFGLRPIWGCENLRRIVVKTEIPVEGYQQEPFGNFDMESCTLVVPAGCKEAYEASPTWNCFNIVEDTYNTGIETANNTDENIRITVDNGLINIGNITAGTEIKVFNTVGELIKRTTAVNNYATISLAENTKGIFIISVKNNNISKNIKINF